jgi:hypothetical protein
LENFIENFYPCLMYGFIKMKIFLFFYNFFFRIAQLKNQSANFFIFILFNLNRKNLFLLFH